MPTLTPVAFIDKTNTPFVWTCSECGEVFSLERMTPTPSTAQVQKVNSAFREHCRHAHADSTVIGLSVDLEAEDASQAAVRIVREAIKDSGG